MIPRDRELHSHAIDRHSQTFTMPAGEIRDFRRNLGETSLSPQGYGRLSGMTNSQRLPDGLGRTAIDLATTALRIDHDASSGILADTVAEGLDAVVLTMLEALNDASPEARDHFHTMTRERANVMLPLRQAYLAAEPDLSTAQKGAVLIPTNLAERTLWLLGQFADQEKATEGEQVG